MSQFVFTSIGTIHSCYKEKFGIPRQPALVQCPATIEIEHAYSEDQAFREIETFSHIWVTFVFHKIKNNWKPTVRPPRLGGNQRIGVFASRSMFRPNPIGLSVVELNGIERKGSNIILNITGGDFLDKTPVLDIKPYVPYADSIANSKSGYATEKPVVKFNIIYSDVAYKEIMRVKNELPKLELIITEVLQLDPRPAYQDKNKVKSEFAIKLFNYDVKWHVSNESIIVTELVLLS